MLDLTEAMKAFTRDVAEKMDSFGKRLEALETQSTPDVPTSAGVLSLNNTSTPVPEV